jgi:hypothetical protein
VLTSVPLDSSAAASLFEESGIVKLSILLTLFFLVPPAHAESFSDVPPSREDHDAVEDVKARGIVQGRPDGTFGPDDFVNRAEAITIVVRAVANAQNLPSTQGCFPDVHGEEWYVKPVCYAKDLEWVGGYPDGTFQPVRTVAKAEYLKILLNAYGEDIELPDALRLPPYLHRAVATSMTSADEFENLNPGAALTRGQVALMLHRYLLYREGRREQSLLTAAERDIRSVFTHLDHLTIGHALFAAHRVRTAAWGAEMRLPESPVVRVTVSLGKALQTLASAYRSIEESDLEAALQAAQKAYDLAEKTDMINKDVTVYTDRVRSYAHDLANAIRSYEE